MTDASSRERQGALGEECGPVPAGERRLDPEARLEHARTVAWRALDRRDRTELELRGALAAKRVAPEEANLVLAELVDGGFVDDARFAHRFAEDRRWLDAWGAERIEWRLHALGVAPEHIAVALAEQGPADEMEAALALLRRRVPDVPATPRGRDRALGLLVRKGYELELAYDALRQHAGVEATSD